MFEKYKNIIKLDDISLFGKHGHFEEEKKEQLFITNLVICGDFEKACTTDEIEDTYNYLEALSIVEDEVKNNSYNLLERLASNIADRILKDGKLSYIEVEIIKPDAFSALGKTGIPRVIIRKEK